MTGHRKLIFFLALLAVSAVQLSGTDLSNVVIALATGFGVANGAEHIGKGMQGNA